MWFEGINSEFTELMKNAVLKEIEAKVGTAADINDAEEGRGDGNGDGIEMLTIEYSENPMHNSSSAGAGLVKITGFDPGMTVRAFLVKLLPEIDLPSVHAVDTAFKEDGVDTMGEHVVDRLKKAAAPSTAAAPF